MRRWINRGAVARFGVFLALVVKGTGASAAGEDPDLRFSCGIAAAFSDNYALSGADRRAAGLILLSPEIHLRFPVGPLRFASTACFDYEVPIAVDGAGGDPWLPAHTLEWDSVLRGERWGVKESLFSTGRPGWMDDLCMKPGSAFHRILTDGSLKWKWGPRLFMEGGLQVDVRSVDGLPASVPAGGTATVLAHWRPSPKTRFCLGAAGEAGTDRARDDRTFVGGRPILGVWRNLWGAAVLAGRIHYDLRAYPNDSAAVLGWSGELYPLRPLFWKGPLTGRLTVRYGLRSSMREDYRLYREMAAGFAADYTLKRAFRIALRAAYTKQDYAAQDYLGAGAVPENQRTALLSGGIAVRHRPLLWVDTEYAVSYACHVSDLEGDAGALLLQIKALLAF